jgi:hypothetical protein
MASPGRRWHSAQHSPSIIAVNLQHYEVHHVSGRLITWLRLDINLETDLGFKPNGFNSRIQYTFPSWQCDYSQPLKGSRIRANPL